MQYNINSPKLRALVERIHRGEKSPASQKKRKWAKTFLIIDAIIITLILIFFYQQKGDSVFQSSNIRYGNFIFRFSFMSNESGKDGNFSLTITSSDKNSKHILNFKNKIADLQLYSKNKIIFSKPIGNNIKKLVLQPSESRVFLLNIDDSMIKSFARENQQLLVRPSNSIFNFRKTDLKLKAEIVINYEKEISTQINFKYKVK